MKVTGMIKADVNEIPQHEAHVSEIDQNLQKSSLIEEDVLFVN